jgi:hypothetical protein
MPMRIRALVEIVVPDDTRKDYCAELVRYLLRTSSPMVSEAYVYGAQEIESEIPLTSEEIPV